MISLNELSIYLFNNHEILDHLSKCLSTIESRFRNSGVILLGDFNNLNVSRIKRNFRLKQILNFLTRGRNTFYLILTDLKEYYAFPIKLSHFGLSDHVKVKVLPLSRTITYKSKIKQETLDQRNVWR
jgi:hypothetical protein